MSVHPLPYRPRSCRWTDLLLAGRGPGAAGFGDGHRSPDSLSAFEVARGRGVLQPADAAEIENERGSRNKRAMQSRINQTYTQDDLGFKLRKTTRDATFLKESPSSWLIHEASN